MSDNPFEAPKSSVSDISTSTDASVLRDQPRKNSFGSGWRWIKEGFGLFKLSPLVWILITIIYVVLNMIPLVSMVASLLFPVFVAGWFYGAREVDKGNELKVSHLFKGFSKNTGSLLAVTGLYLLGIVISLAAAAAVAYAVGAFDSFTRIAVQQDIVDPLEQFNMMKSLALPGLVYLALLIPVMMMVWLAPALVIFNDLGAIEAMKRSFDGCLKNFLPYLLFSIVAFVFLILGLIPLLLGLLVVMPALLAAVYVSYKDIYLD